MAAGAMSNILKAGSKENVRMGFKGVGKKTAEMICVELKDKVSEFAFAGSGDRNVAAPLAKDASADSVEAIIKLALSGGK